MNKFSPIFDNISTVLPAGLQYVPQDNYYLADLSVPETSLPVSYLYSDGATSCIIVIVVGQKKASATNTLVALAHLSRQETFEAFFELVEQRFFGEIALYAQGANPPEINDEMGDILTNEQILKTWVDKLALSIPDQNLRVTQQILALGEGSPLVHNRDCLGIDLKTLQVSKQRLPVTETHRDGQDGLQTLFSLFGQELQPPLMLRPANQLFTKRQIIDLVTIAFHYNWIDILPMSDEEMLHYFSTTPQYEVPWFCDALRQSALYVKHHLHLIE